MTVKELSDKDEKRRIARLVLEALPDWFGIPESREGYIRESAEDGDEIEMATYLK